ncbi:DegT/DnrJ/EryC1/StrS aminotransferase family protein [Spirosoma sp. 209]|uniref:DegT/DnrJ/EryC1/StrS family aminotransferase n=1 Tax=Spirosoma sp. 209 TaxID=1955701 RepID=UPI00098CFEBE|nr:DegT/DnrJ/EryC1/StrS family aminotransferase [Spirosoma sp. 209]
MVATHKIPFLDLRKQYHQLKDEVLKVTEEVFESNAFSGGPYVATFERAFADYCGTSHAMGVNNGTTALQLAMLALGVGPGDEVIIPANTFIATAWGASHVGATPVFVDCDPNTWEIDASKIAERITERTKVIAGVHLYGQPFDIAAVQAVAEQHNLRFIEDAAQAHGARYNGTRVGGFGEMACFSFYPGKNLGAYGEAGGITTNHRPYYDHVLSLRNHGSQTRYYHDEIGYNMRMDGLQGAILSIKLRYIDQWNARRQAIADRYQQEITNPGVRMQQQPGFAESVYHLFVVTVENRADFLRYLEENNIVAGLHYPVPCHLQKAYESLGYHKGDFPQAEYLAEHCVSLPMFAELTDEEVNQVIDVINRY